MEIVECRNGEQVSIDQFDAKKECGDKSPLVAKIDHKLEVERKMFPEGYYETSHLNDWITFHSSEGWLKHSSDPEEETT